MAVNIVLNKVLKKITPSEKEQKEMHSVTRKVLAITDQVIKTHGLGRVLAGSFTRDTWLTHKKEFDLFILFPENWERENLEKIGLEVGQKIVKKLKGESVVAYAEHPYTRAKLLGFDVDIVPCYKVKSAEKIKSAVDRTPFHNKYVAKHLKKTMSPQVRLLKQFTKSIGVYGSDLKTQGFSGYLCELLIIKFGSFEKLLRKVVNWEPGQVFIDLEGRYKGTKKEFKEQPLVFIDPVDPKRNVAAAMSPSNFIKFIQNSIRFLEYPTEKLFFLKKKKLGAKEISKIIKQRETRFLAITFKRPDVVEDVLYPQLRKTANRLKAILKEYEFVTIGSAVWTDEKECLILLEMEVWNLPNTRRIKGPSVFSLDNAENFSKKYKKLGKVWPEDGILMAETKRQFKTAEVKLKDSLSDPLEQLKAKGIASYPAKSISKDFKILKEKQIMALLKRPGFGEFLTKYFE